MHLKCSGAHADWLTKRRRKTRNRGSPSKSESESNHNFIFSIFMCCLLFRSTVVLFDNHTLHCFRYDPLHIHASCLIYFPNPVTITINARRQLTETHMIINAKSTTTTHQYSQIVSSMSYGNGMRENCTTNHKHTCHKRPRTTTNSLMDVDQ